MKKIALSVLSVSALVLTGQMAQAAQAPSAVIHVLECSELTAGPDHGLEVSIVHPVTPGQKDSSLIATVSAQSIAGPRAIQSYRVARQSPVAIGSPVHFVGRGFDLEVNSTTTPIQGGSYSRLVAETKHGRIAAELVCRFTR